MQWWGFGAPLALSRLGLLSIAEQADCSFPTEYQNTRGKPSPWVASVLSASDDSEEACASGSTQKWCK